MLCLGFQVSGFGKRFRVSGVRCQEKVSGVSVQVSGKDVRCQPRRWPEKFTRLRRATSLIEKETLAM